jgi:hypothetical protein
MPVPCEVCARPCMTGRCLRCRSLELERLTTCVSCGRTVSDRIQPCHFCQRLAELKSESRYSIATITLCVLFVAWLIWKLYRRS